MGINPFHFRGKTKGRKTRRRGKGLSKKERLAKRGLHKNKYEHLVENRARPYDAEDKTYRDLPIKGVPNSKVPEGTTTIFHGRLYSLVKSVRLTGSGEGRGKFKLVRQID